MSLGSILQLDEAWVRNFAISLEHLGTEKASLLSRLKVEDDAKRILVLKRFKERAGVRAARGLVKDTRFGGWHVKIKEDGDNVVVWVDKTTPFITK